MAAASITINVMLAVHAKRTTAVDMYKPLRQYIVMHYSEREAQDLEDDLQLVQQMRSEVEKAGDSLDSRRDLLQRYFRALSVMESRFPISNEREHVNSLSFSWYDAFKQGRKASQQNIHFEKAAIAFNLGAVQSQLALSADRTTAAGLKQACNCFQAAAGAFALLRDHISMKASGASSTLDISVECAGMLERLMLAQAQECFFEKVLADSKPALLCSKVAKHVGLYYEEAHAALVLPPLNQHFDRTWVSHVQLKAAQFQAEACYRAALDLHDKDNIAEEIGRLKAASALLADARRSAKGVVNPLLDAVTKLEGNVNRKLEVAIKENDRVYLMRVPNPDSLPPLPAASLVKSTSLGDVLDASKEEMFASLVPDSSAKALSKYTEMVDDIIRSQAEKLQQESDITRVKLREMDLPDSLIALEGTAGLPDQLNDDVEAVQIDGCPAGLETEMKQLRDLRRVNEELLAQTHELLEKESREDAQFRSQFGIRWSRPQSSTLTKNLLDRANGFTANLKQAGDSDAKIERSIRDNYPVMAILDTRPIEAALPTLGIPIMSLNGDEDSIVGSLRQKLGQLEMLGSQRAGIEDMLKEMKRKDNILPKLMTTLGSYEDLFKKELAKYDTIRLEVTKNVEAQEQLLEEIKATNHAFSATFNVDEYKASRDKVYKQIRSAVAKYREIRDNINEGLKFYVTLQDAITNLRQQCSDFVMTRSIQSREMVDDLQQQVAGLKLSNHEASSAPGRVYPAVGQPPQRPAPSVPQQPAQQNTPYYHQNQQTANSNSSGSPLEQPYQYPGSYPPQKPQHQQEQHQHPQQQPSPYYPPHGQSGGSGVGSSPSTPPPYYNPHHHNYSQPPYPGWQGPYYNTPNPPPYYSGQPGPPLPSGYYNSSGGAPSGGAPSAGAYVKHQ